MSLRDNVAFNDERIFENRFGSYGDYPPQTHKTHIRLPLYNVSIDKSINMYTACTFNIVKYILF